ncbi:MAG: DUF421 domain-containing protein [Myxococcaceae bacterium]
MNEFSQSLFGRDGETLNTLQMTSRAIAVFFLALAFIRVAGMRSFGRKSAFDVTISILLGAILARAITGGAPFWPTMCAAAALVLVKRLTGHMARHSSIIEHMVKGRHRVLCENGQMDSHAMARTGMSEADLVSGLRAAACTDRLDAVRRIIVEADGHVTVVRD